MPLQPLTNTNIIKIVYALFFVTVTDYWKVIAITDPVEERYRPLAVEYSAAFFAKMIESGFPNPARHRDDVLTTFKNCGCGFLTKM